MRKKETFKERYARERAVQRKIIEDRTSAFIAKITTREYRFKIYLFALSLIVLAALAIFSSNCQRLIALQESRRDYLISEIKKENDIFKYERNVVISYEPIEKARAAADKIAAIQNKYIVAVLEDVDSVAEIDRELALSRLILSESESVSWINLNNRETLKQAFNSGDFYWVGYADNSLNKNVSIVGVFFVLYDGGVPVQIIEYEYESENNVLKNRTDWG